MHLGTWRSLLLWCLALLLRLELPLTRRLLLMAPLLFCFLPQHRLAPLRHLPLLLLLKTLLLLLLLLGLLLLLKLAALLHHLVLQRLRLLPLAHQLFLNPPHLSLLLSYCRIRRFFHPLFHGSVIPLLE